MRMIEQKMKNNISSVKNEIFPVQPDHAGMVENIKKFGTRFILFEHKIPYIQMMEKTIRNDRSYKGGITMKAMIIYYSRTGTTEKLAQRIQKDFDCDILKLEAEDPYGNYFSSLVRANKERKNNVPVKVITPVPALTYYDTVFVGYPIWWLDVPVLVADFIKDCDLDGKNVIPFSTSGLGNISVTLDTLRKSCPKSDVILPLQWGMTKKEDYEKWMNEVKVTPKTMVF